MTMDKRGTAMLKDSEIQEITGETFRFVSSDERAIADYAYSKGAWDVVDWAKDDMSLYRYLSARLESMGIQKPKVIERKETE